MSSKKEEMYLSIFSIVCMSLGVILLAIVDWKAPIGVFLFGIGNNTEQRIQIKKFLKDTLHSPENKE